jgi:hypothetical protein
MSEIVERADMETFAAMVGPGMYRVTEIGDGFQPEQFYQTKEKPLWLPLKPNGYWADPDAYSTSKITQTSVMSRVDAERAVWLAKKINHGRGL